MARLLDALEAGQDLGHYGQFTFVTVARHFMDEEAILDLLERQPEMDRSKALALVEHVKERGYNPPHRDRIVEQQAKGGFQIIENPQDPDTAISTGSCSSPKRSTRTSTTTTRRRRRRANAPGILAPGNRTGDLCCTEKGRRISRLPFHVPADTSNGPG